MTESAPDVHSLPPDRFLEEVHSFEFWFHAVEGYLSATRYGRRPDTLDIPLAEPERDRLITVLCHYCIGETAALEASSGLITIAPNRLTKVFLATQVVDEGRHLEVLLHRLQDLGVTNPELEIERRATRSLVAFKRRLLELVEGKDWEAAIFAQNVILECLEFTVFQAHAETADPVTRDVLQGIVKDERRHIGFGENELGRRLKTAPHTRARLAAVRHELDPLVLTSCDETLVQIGIPPSARPEIGRSYLAAVHRLGFA